MELVFGSYFLFFAICTGSLLLFFFLVVFIMMFLIATERKHGTETITATIEHIDKRVYNGSTREFWHIILTDGTRRTVMNSSNVLCRKLPGHVIDISGRVKVGMTFTMGISGWEIPFLTFYKNVYKIFL